MSTLFSRPLSMLLFMGIGVAAADYFGWKPRMWEMGLGFAMGGCCWLLWDSWCFVRFLDWLRHLQEYPSMPKRYSLGVWREAAERVFRLLRHQVNLRQERENHLEYLQAVLQASPNGVIVLSKDEHIEWCNHAACQHFGLDAQRDIGQLVTHLLRDPAFVSCIATRDFGQAITLTSAASPAAHPLRLSVRICPYEQGNGNLFLLSQDITLFEQAEAIQRDFVANVSHEIRTPLTVLAGFIETLQTLSLSEEERQEYLERMARQSVRMRNLVDDLLTLSRLEDSPPPGLGEWMSIQKLLQQCETDARALSALTTGENAPHRIVFPDAGQQAQTGEIAGAASELQSALFNLISNAIRYTPPGGDIVIGWRVTDNGNVLFSVRDSGPGIAPEHIARLTERFYRVDNDRSRRSGGTGLGLSIVSRVLQRHNAVLHIESTPGRGTYFAIEFPAARIRYSAPD
jgi:two-component system phosphate regulon sensor histidine kinase PhoR